MEIDEGSVLVHEKGLEMVRNIYDELDHNPWLLNVKNGTVDMLSGEFEPVEFIIFYKNASKVPLNVIKCIVLPSFL